MGRLVRVGLTGGIASGKTTVAGFFAEMGACVLDADRIAHQAIEPGGPAYESVVARFGKDVVDPDGRIVRSALARIVFHDPAARAELEAVVHPRVREEIARRIEACEREARHTLVVVEAALMVETGTYRLYDRLVVVRCSPDSQMARLASRGLPADEALARLDAQLPVDEKVALADFVIDTDTTLRETREQTVRVVAALLAAGPRSA